MGFNTSITIVNDGIDQIRKFPDDFVEGITSRLTRGGDFGVGNHAGIVTVHATDHADATQLIAVGGNFSTKVHTGWYVGSHHTEAGQLALLKQWADALGYRVSRKPVAKSVTYESSGLDEFSGATTHNPQLAQENRP